MIDSKYSTSLISDLETWLKGHCHQILPPIFIGYIERRHNETKIFIKYYFLTKLQAFEFKWFLRGFCCLNCKQTRGLREVFDDVTGAKLAKWSVIVPKKHLKDGCNLYQVSCLVKEGRIIIYEHWGVVTHFDVGKVGESVKIQIWCHLLKILENPAFFCHF